MSENGSENRRQILVVDDEPEIVKLICRALRAPDRDISSTSDPREALELLSKRRFDVLLCDVDMPGLSGHDVMRHARKANPKAIRVFVTGANRLEAAVRAINEGEVHRFVNKPFDLLALAELVTEAITRKDELDRVSEAASRSERRAKLVENLEREHPGISDVQRDSDGAYVVERKRTIEAAKRVGLSDFVTG